METFFYCQGCDAKITVEALGTLDGGKCPECGGMEGFSTLLKSQGDPFETVTIINDAEMIEKTLEGE